jgi:hypothetical protein
MQADLGSLYTEVYSGHPGVSKDLSLVSFISKWSGTEQSLTVTESLETVESTLRIENWGDADKMQTTVLKLTEVAKALYGSFTLN